MRGASVVLGGVFPKLGTSNDSLLIVGFFVVVSGVDIMSNNLFFSTRTLRSSSTLFGAGFSLRGFLV